VKTKTTEHRQKLREETKMEMQARLRIHQAVEYIKQDVEFPFDTHDEPEEILNYYNISLDLQKKEKQLLLTEITVITEGTQTREIVRQTSEMVR
jgi:hypothetical protein